MLIHSRSEWGARKPKRHNHLGTVRELWLHHTAGSPHQKLADIQRFHIDAKGWRDFAYNAAVRHDGSAWEGCGLDAQGAHTRGRNHLSKAIVAIGNFQTIEPTPAMLEGIAQLVAHGILAGHWDCQITGGHRDAPGASTACCGDRLHAQIPNINRRAAEIIHGVAVMAELPTRREPRYRVDPHGHMVADLPAPGGGAWVLFEDGGVFAVGGAPFYGSPVNEPYWSDGGVRRAVEIEPFEKGYLVVAHTGERYAFPGHP